MKNGVFGASVAALAGVARAAPQRVGIGIVPVIPGTNATTPKPTPTDTGSICEASCEVRYPELFGISWAREIDIVFTETITVGTISFATLVQNNKTTFVTDTIYDDTVPRYYTLYEQSTNEAGTKVVAADITLSDGPMRTTFAYPTPWVDYPLAYHWQGILPTHDEKDNSFCATYTEELGLGELTAHPLYPQPTGYPDKKDPEGANYVPIYIALQELPDKKWFDNAFPSESAFASCESVSGKPAPMDISTAKFVLATYSFVSSLERPGLVHQESTVLGFEETTTQEPPDFRPTEEPEPESSSQTLPRISERPPQIPHIETSVLPWIPTPTSPNGNTPVRPGAGQPTPTVNNPAPSTPILTFIPTTIAGHPTATPVFILPDSSTASIGQTLTLNARPTVLAAPPILFALVPTSINGIATSAPAFIISGTSTATIGQTVTLDGQTTVLAAPAPFATILHTTIGDVEADVMAFVVSGSVTALPGQTVTLDGSATVLPTADVVLTGLTTTVNGGQTVVPVWIISGSVTATAGQTVTLGGTATVLGSLTATGEASRTGAGAEGGGGGLPGGPVATGSMTGGAERVGWGRWVVGVGIMGVLWLGV